MKLFAISDLHLSFGTNKPMDVFYGWENYTARLKENWEKIVGDDDTVVIAGDVSWAISLDEALSDFKFLNELPGQKIILKGNHDFWWSTASKINEFLLKNKLDSIKILHNNCYFDENYALCGSRGWYYDGSGEQDEKIIKRECGRIEASLRLAKEAEKEAIVFLHYPPAYSDFVSDEIISVLEKYNIKRVFYGHIHGSGAAKIIYEHNGIKLRLISADSVGFTPVLITDCGIFK